MSKMLDTWNVADVLRSEQGWNSVPESHATAADFGFDLYPLGVRTYARGFSLLGDSSSMFICTLGDRYSNEGETTGSRISGVNCCWYLSPVSAKGTELTIVTNHIVGTTAMPVRCVKNY